MTKHFLLSTLILFFISFQSKAQISTIIEGGINLSTIEVTKPETFDFLNSIENRTGFYISIIPTFRTEKIVSFNTEIQYSLEGYKSPINSPDERFHYVRFIPQIEIKPFPLLGIYGGYNFGLNITDIPPISIFSGLGFTTAKRTDSGLMAGVRLYLGKLSLTAKYNSGIKNIDDLNYTGDAGQPIEVEKRNRNFQVGVGYLFFKK